MILAKALVLLFSTCPGNWPFSSPQMLSCPLYGHPAEEKHRHTHVMIGLLTPDSTPLPRSETLLTVAKVAWNKRFSKRLPSAKVSS